MPEPISHPPLTTAPSTGSQVAAWIEHYCVYGEGDHYGEQVRLELFEKLYLIWLFELRPDGRRRYRRALLQVPRGNGKTALAAWVALYLLAHQKSPVIPIVANSFDQSDLVFHDLRTCVAESPKLLQPMEPFEDEVQIRGGPGRVFKVPAAAPVLHGMRPTGAVFDELHQFVGPREEVYRTITLGAAKRGESQPLFISTTTPGWDKTTLAGRLHDLGTRVNKGETADRGFLFVHWGCPADRYDLGTESGLLACIRDANPAAGLFLDVEEVAAAYSEVPESEWLRYHAGLWVPSAQTWLPQGAWDACAAPDTVVADHTEVCIGFDGSVNNDSTAIVAATCAPEPHIFVIDVWERDEADPDWAVPVIDVEAAIRAACLRFKVREIVADRFRWQRSLQILESEGLPVVEFPQTSGRMGPATGRFFEAVVNKTVTHSGDPVLARHLSNACLKVDARGQRLVKETKWSPRKIDAALAACMAFYRGAVPIEPEYDLYQSVL